MELKCDTCGRVFTGRRDARYCSGQCRTGAYRQRHGLAAVKPLRRTPLPESFDRVAWDLLQRSERLARLAEDDRMPRNREVIRTQSARCLVLAAEHIQTALDRLGWQEPSQPAQL